MFRGATADPPTTSEENNTPATTSRRGAAWRRTGRRAARPPPSPRSSRSLLRSAEKQRSGGSLSFPAGARRVLEAAAGGARSPSLRWEAPTGRSVLSTTRGGFGRPRTQPRSTALHAAPGKIPRWSTARRGARVRSPGFCCRARCTYTTRHDTANGTGDGRDTRIWIHAMRIHVQAYRRRPAVGTTLVKWMTTQRAGRSGVGEVPNARDATTRIRRNA